MCHLFCCQTLPLYATAPDSFSISFPCSSLVATALTMSNPTTIPTVDPVEPNLHPCQLMIPETTVTPATVPTSSPTSCHHSPPIYTGCITPTANPTTLQTADSCRLILPPHQPLITEACILAFAWFYWEGFK